MNIGYACLTLGVLDTKLQTCSLKNVTPEKLLELSEANLDVLDRMLTYNAKNHIRLFRISSDIIPFASHPDVSFPWREVLSEKLLKIGEKARRNHIRLSMHPGQYTVLNSPSKEVVERAILDLEYHCEFLDALQMGKECKVILHIGGAYGDKQSAMERFKVAYQGLEPFIKNRLIIENDDKIYNVSEVLSIGTDMGIPVVFDVFHHAINPSPENRSVGEWLLVCAKTWEKADGIPKIHYSQQAPGKKPGSHSDTIGLEDFYPFYQSLPTEVDIMLEVKDKNLSAVKCILATEEDGEIQELEKEWALYKYAVLEKSPRNYQKIRTLLKEKNTFPVAAFYEQIDGALALLPDRGKSINAMEHVWGYFKKEATEAEKKTYEKRLEKYREGSGSASAVKKHLWRLAEKYGEKYLLTSYYFFM